MLVNNLVKVIAGKNSMLQKKTGSRDSSKTIVVAIEEAPNTFEKCALCKTIFGEEIQKLLKNATRATRGKLPKERVDSSYS